MTKPKSINSLMKYLRDKKGIKISGSSDKRKLMNMGYYHGYKGYRYIGRSANIASYSSFDELMAVYEFDTHLKALMYPSVMSIETALKNYVLEIIVEGACSVYFPDIYAKILNNYKMFLSTRNHNKLKQEIKKRMELRNMIYQIQTRAYEHDDKITAHFINRDKNMPIWAIFELISLGTFGYFVSCINMPTRLKISSKLGIPNGYDTNGVMPQRLIYALKDLRNAIAHNKIIFDTRFRTCHIDKQVGSVISHTTGVQNLQFTVITDYLVLIVYLLKIIKINKTEMKNMVREYIKIVEKLRKSIPVNIFNQIIPTDNKLKINTLINYIKI